MRALIISTVWLCGLLAGTAAAQALRVEPPNWWVGMQDSHLQLLLEGPGVGQLRAHLEDPRVRLVASTRLESDDHLFLDLELAADAQPGPLALALTDADGRRRHQLDYPLLARAPGSAQRRGFGPQDVIYLVVPDRFANGDPGNDTLPGLREAAERSNPGGRHGGDLAGLRAALPWLAELGITQIWATPLVENDQPAWSYHGYASTDGYRIDPRFGSNEDYRDFVAAARDHGIGVVKDVVLNHIGHQHRWMHSPPAPDWIHQHGREQPTQHARTTLLDRYAAASDRRRFSDGWFVETMPDLNQRQPQLATWLIQNSLWWIEYAGLSGIRQDTWSYADPAFLAAWAARIEREYPQFSIVGEEWSRNPWVVSHWLAGNEGRVHGHAHGVGAMMDFPLHYTLIESLNQPQSWDGGMMRLYEALVDDGLYPQPARMVLFDGNHDTPRIYSRLGNDPARWRAAMLYLLTMPRTPQLFYGTEVLMRSPLQRDDGRTRADFPGGWAGDRVNAFTGRGLDAEQRAALDFMRTLLNWRKQRSVIHQGALTHFVPDDGLYVWFRHDAQATVMVALNRSERARRLQAARFDEVLQGRRLARAVIEPREVDLERLTLAAGESMLLEIPAPGATTGPDAAGQR